jgi:hypothetical protein
VYGFTSRTLVRLDVELWHQHSRLGIFTTRDMDDHAVFIELRDQRLCSQDVVRMEFLINQKGVLKYPLEGEVVRCADDGIAVMFLSENFAFFQALAKKAAVVPDQPSGQADHKAADAESA